ncbi:hypothetical protein PHYBOEH_011591 [Phytophthora boehmeriae]|uniref:RING-type domain-containing protein n=1 Tax=Phytophthora boehmeriae TaxID=109152 RepID=A0A8T1XE44_9STRA|nr:hypothetical protein PHYBOEH_011591 [Phytophthora boehmeriae]
MMQESEASDNANSDAFSASSSSRTGESLPETSAQVAAPVPSFQSSSVAPSTRLTAGLPPPAMDSLPRPFAPSRRHQVDPEMERRLTMESSPSSFTGRASSDGVQANTSQFDSEGTPDDAEQLRQRFLSAALTGPLSNEAVSGRLLQALPQLSIGQFLQEINSQTPSWRGFSSSRQNSSDTMGVGATVEDSAEQVDETGRLLSPPSAGDEARPNSPSRSRRRSSASSLYSMSASGDFERNDDHSSQQEHGVDISDGPQSDATDSTRPRRNTDESDDQTALDDLQSLFRRCHNSLPFVALFLIYFAYQHATGILVFVVGTVAVMGLDQRLRVQVALKDKANTWHLLGIVVMCVIDMVAICSVDGEPNPFHHFSKMLHSRATHSSGSDSGSDPTGGIFWEVLWTVLVNDFLVRLWSVIVKAFVTGAKSERFHCERKHQESATSSAEQSPIVSIADGEEDNVSVATPLTSHTSSSASFYRRKRKLYGIIEMISIFLRSLLASIPWCSFYQLCASKFMADLFTFAYLFIKGLILASQGRRIFVLARSLVTLGLEFGTYITHDELVEAGSPDCSICYESMRKPVKLACSHMFCEECVTEWFDHERSCPLCRASVGSSGTTDETVKPQYMDGRTSLVPQLL